MNAVRIPTHLSDDALLARFDSLDAADRRGTAAIVAVIAEVDRRRLYRQRACSSMFAYCTEVMRFSENMAYLRIRAARLARRFPVVLAMLADGRVHLSGLAALAAHLTADNAETLLARATHKTKRQIQALVAEVAPRPDVPTTVRRLPAPRSTAIPPRAPAGAAAPGQPSAAAPCDAAGEPAAVAPAAARSDDAPAERAPRLLATPAAPAPRAAVQPLAPARYRVQFTADQAFHDKLTQLRGLLRHQVPDGDLAGVLEIAVSEKLTRVLAKKFGHTERPRKTAAACSPAGKTRHVPQPVKREIYLRDGGRCTYVDARTGRRCSATENLHYHHEVPYAIRPEHHADEIRLLCEAHNVYQAELDFGVEHMARFRNDRADEPRAPYGPAAAAHG